MPRLNDVRRALSLDPQEPDLPLRSMNEALARCPEPAARDVVRVAGGQAAREALDWPGLPLLLEALRDAVMSAQPEQALVTLIHAWTGGFAELRASWGDHVASAGTYSRQAVTHRLAHRERQVGALVLALPDPWDALTPVFTEYALLSRLQAAAAGAARRRVKERVLESLLSGLDDHADLGGEPFAVAVASLPERVSAGPASLTAREDALDVLAAVGEGYLTERRLSGYSTVRGGQAVWLWSTLSLGVEGRELHEALTSSTAQDVRLGVSGRHEVGVRGVVHEVRSAYAQARQALAATRAARGYTPFHGMDPLFALLSEGRLDILARQVQGQLAALNDGGRAEGTLRAYLAHRGPLADLAAQQGIHLNTLRYRLRRAEDALGGRLSDPELLARLYLAFEAAPPPRD
ncbi:PucR family transcriptional regulator [Deinococcus ficus]|uniref:PucR family transcriptional regulator n=1 Tax=Deinococcus ficus TaxID=317577 RepID=UPI0003B3377E|nr:helix-turn-helix domain-containing protein [Deinococcus ficus]